jgi:excisionase family DNA binding protein
VPKKESFMNNDKWLRLEELAEYLKLGRTKLYQMAQEGELPASKVGSQWRFDREEIDDWVRAQRCSGQMPPRGRSSKKHT